MSRMGWTGLFGSKPPRIKPDPQVRWFGKLPTYADYYTSKGDEEWAVEFNTWVLDGFEAYLNLARQESKAAPRSPHGVARLPLSAGAIRLPGSNVTVLASFHDYGGDMVGRPFPMCFYVAVPTSQWPGPTSQNVGGAIRAVRSLISVREQVNQHFNAPGGFESRFGSYTIDLSGVDGAQNEESWLTGATALPMTEWYDGTRSEADAGDLATWTAGVARSAAQIAALESPDFKPTFALPLAPKVDMHVQVAGWLRWLEGSMDLKRRTLSLLVVADPSGQPRRLVVIAREVGAEDFLLLTPLLTRLRYVDDLSQVKSAEPGGPDDSSTPETPATWAEFVRRDPPGRRGERAS